MNRKLLWYLIITFGLSWGITLIWWLSIEDTSVASESYVLMALVYMFMPMVAALTVQKLIFRSDIKKPLGISFNFNRWWIVAWLLPLVLALLTLLVSLLFPQVSYAPDMAGFIDRFADVLPPEQLEEIREMELPIHPLLLGIIQALIAGITINAVAGFGEELGWRGIMHDSLRSMNFWKASVLIGTVWGFWHTPVILMGHNYPGYPIIGIFMMIVWCILLSCIFSLIRIKSGSVIAASILHGTINGSYGLSIMMVSGGGVLLSGLTGVAGFLVLILMIAGIYFFWPETIYKTMGDLEDDFTGTRGNDQ